MASFMQQIMKTKITTRTSDDIFMMTDMFQVRD